VFNWGTLARLFSNFYYKNDFVTKIITMARIQKTMSLYLKMTLDKRFFK
jgi:hypothetical protein